jgi:hypothetical protein
VGTPDDDGAGRDGGQARPVSSGEVVGGIFVGLVVTFIYMAVLSGVSISMDDADGLSTGENWMLFAASLLPLVVSVAVLSSRALRQSAAGFVMGFAIGTLALSGLCTSLAVPGLSG